MVAKTRPLVQAWNPEYRADNVSLFPNLLVSGCSFTDNISMTESVTWPWYLKTLFDFTAVYDCSQSGAGNNHIFNSIINEIETNANINSHNTLTVVMWSSWSRADVIGSSEVTKNIHSVSNYQFSDNFCTLSLYRQPRDTKSEEEKLCAQYARVVDPEAQVYESCLKIIALKNYLENKKMPYVFCSWKKLEAEYSFVKDQAVQYLAQQISNHMAPIISLDEYATGRNLRAPDGHPDTEAHLRWSRHVLMPYIIETFGAG